MSIIHEALKKAGRAKGSLPSRGKSGPARVISRPPEKYRYRRPALLVGAAALVITGLTAMAAMRYLSSNPTVKSGPSGAVVVLPTPPQTPIAGQPRPSSAPRTVPQPPPDKGPHVEELNVRGSKAFDRGDYLEAASLFGESLKGDPNQHMIRNNLGLALKKAGDRKGAEREYRYLILHGSSDPWAHNNLGVLLEETGREDEALAEYRKALEIKPDYPDAQLNVALLLEKKGRKSEAVVHYQAFLNAAGEEYRGLAQKVARHIKAAGSR